MVLRENSSDADSNITLGMYGEYCHFVQDITVVCEKNKGNIFHKSFILYSKNVNMLMK